MDDFIQRIIQRPNDSDLKFKRGMQLFSEPPLLKFGGYLNPRKLPSVPFTSFGHLRAATPPDVGGWGMLGNDRHADCVMAGAAHESMIFAWATNRTVPGFTVDGITKQYFEHTGGRDTGLNPVKIAQWRQDVGLLDAQNVRHKIDAYVHLETLEQVDLCVYLFGVAGFCWVLPKTAERQFVEHEVWNDISQPPDPREGHYTTMGGKNSAGHREFVTWGAIQAATDAYCAKYMYPGAAIGYLSREYLLGTGQSPEGVDWDLLEEDLAEIRDN